MKNSLRLSIAALGVIMLGMSAPFALADAEIPDRPRGPSGEDWYVLDNANVLSAETEAALQTQLNTLVQETSTSMVVLTIPSLNDYPIEMYALEVGRGWGVGQEEFDNGLVFLVVPGDQEARIEVGYGLEGAITDAQSSMILNQVAIPYFKQEDYDTGTLETMRALETLARGEEFNLDELSAPSTAVDGDFWYMVIFFFLPLGWALVSWFSSTKAWWLGGIFGAVFGIFIGGGWAGIAIAAFGGLFLDYIVSTFLFEKIKGPNGKGGSWWSSGGSSSGGGFSGFGGGGFGGGGASGRW